MTYYVGGTQRFTHSEQDADGNPISQQLGRWSVSNPTVASITTDGLATWLAPGETEIMFTIASYQRVGALHAVVHSVAAATLASAPSSPSVAAGSLKKLSISGEDADSNAITDLALDSAVSSDESIAQVLELSGTDLLVLGVALGSCTITVTSGAASIDIPVTVASAGGGGGGAVSSVFTRIGDVVKQAGDYAVGDITGAASAASVTAEASTRASADTTLQTNITAEATARAAADSAEATARNTAIAAAVANLINSAPGALDTLKELADAIGDDPNFAATLTGLVSTEAAARAAADTTLQTNITSEATTRAAAITAEASARSTADALLAPLASPALTGHPTGVTEAALDNSTRLSTTAYTDAAVAVEVSARGTAVTAEASTRAAADTTLQTNINSEVTRAEAAEVLLAPLASPALTGHPTGVTEAPLNNSTRLGTTAYTDAAVAVEASRASAAEALKAPLASPALTGHPTGVTESPLDNSTRLASTAYADAAVAAEAAARATSEALLAPLASPHLTGTPVAPTPSAGDNATHIATTAYVDGAIATLINSAPGTLDTLGEIATALAADETVASALATTVAGKAPLASPSLTGTPLAPTAAGGTNTTQLATTAFVHGEVATEATARASADSTEATARANADALLAPLASPALTGHPTGVTESPSDNSTRLASTAYADAAVAVETVARAAAIAALSFAPLASPAFTGHPTGVTEAALNNSTRLSTTAYTDAAVAVENSRATTAEGLLAPLASPAFTGHPTGVTEAANDSSTKLATTQFVLDNDMGLMERYAVTSGALAATYPRNIGLATTNQTASASGTITLQCILLRKGMSISAIRVMSGSTAGAGMTHQWFALFDSSRNKVAITSDDTSTAWGATTMKSLSIAGGPYVVPATGFYYIGVLFTFTTSAASFAGPAAGNNAAVEGAAPIIRGTADTGLTTTASCPSTLAAITAGAKQFYAEVA